LGWKTEKMVPIKELLAKAGTIQSEQGRPLVTLSYAQSLDGSLTTRRGSPLTLSSPQAMALTHQLRAAHDAILVGIGTVLADNPRLTVRLVSGRNPQPILLDSKLRTPPQARLLEEPPYPWLAAGESALPEQQARLEAAGARVLRFALDGCGRIPLDALLARLAQEGISSLMVEGGTRVISAFLKAGLVDNVLLTLAPVFIGGLHALEASGPEGALPHQPRLQNMGFEKLGEDLIVWGNLS